jgi:VanZ family protein
MTVALTPQLRRIGWGVTLLSLSVIGLATMIPQPPAPIASHFCLLCGSFGTVDAILNVLLFIPLGVGLALTGVASKRAVLAMLALSTLIETAQLLLIAGRDATVGDILTNTLGGAFGFTIARFAPVWLRPSRRVAFALSAGSIALWVAIQAVSAYGFSPAFPNSGYFGEIAPRLGGFDQFPGRVVGANVGNVVVPETRFEDTQAVREQLLEGAMIGTTVLSAGRTDRLAPIVRVADDRQREIVLLAQDGTNMVFEARTGASVLHLRPPFFVLPAVFTSTSLVDGDAADTLSLSAQYVTRAVRLSAQSGRAANAQMIPVSSSLGWTMFLPFRWYIGATRPERIFGVIWIAGLLVVAGYWGAGLIGVSTVDRRIAWVTPFAVAVAVLYIGLALVPKLFGLPVALPGDWLAAVAGIALGVVIQAQPFTSRFR